MEIDEQTHLTVDELRWLDKIRGEINRQYYGKVSHIYIPYGANLSLCGKSKNRFVNSSFYRGDRTCKTCLKRFRKHLQGKKK